MKKTIITLQVLKEILPSCDMEEVRKISLKIRGDADQYNRNELSEMLILLSERLIKLCSTDHKEVLN